MSGGQMGLGGRQEWGPDGRPGADRRGATWGPNGR